jgi:hypothetical protein
LDNDSKADPHAAPKPPEEPSPEAATVIDMPNPLLLQRAAEAAAAATANPAEPEPEPDGQPTDPAWIAAAEEPALPAEDPAFDPNANTTAPRLAPIVITGTASPAAALAPIALTDVVAPAAAPDAPAPAAEEEADPNATALDLKPLDPPLQQPSGAEPQPQAQPQPQPNDDQGFEGDERPTLRPSTLYPRGQDPRPEYASTALHAPIADPHAAEPAGPAGPPNIEVAATALIDPVALGLRPAEPEPAPKLTRHPPKPKPPEPAALDGNSTLLLDQSALGVKPAPPRPVDPLPVPLGSSTMLLDSAVLGLEPAPAEPVKQKAGAFSRKHPDQAQVTTTLGDESSSPRLAGGNGKKLAIGVAVVVGSIVVLALLFGSGSKPSEPELQLAYPYGFNGAHGPRGEVAPPAPEVKYTYQEEVTCNKFERCLRYQYSKGEFQGTMVVGKDPTGHWVRASDEGMPFPPRVDSR